MSRADLNESAQRLAAWIKNDYESDMLYLPMLPDIALRIRAAVNNPRNSMKEVAAVIQFDPTMTARLIQAANSALYTTTRRINTAADAITRLGIDQVRQLTLSFAVQSVFKSSHPLIMNRMRAIWNRSIYVAAISRVLGRIGPDLDPDRALLAGLIHDIGTLPVLYYATHFPELLEQSTLLEELISRLRGKLGVMVLRHWAFDPDLFRVPLEVEKWQRNPRPMPDYVDAVLLANIFSRFGSRHRYNGPPLTTLPAFHKFPLNAFGAEGGVEILEEAKEEISTVMRLFRG